MQAVIYRVPEHEGAGKRDVAGRPLLQRQLQWLRNQGIDDVAVELGTCSADVALAEWLLGSDPLAAHAQPLPSDAPLGPRALTTRAGFDPDSGVLELPAHALCNFDLAPWVEAAQTVRLQPEVPDCPGTSTLQLVLRFLLGDDAGEARPAEGWGAATEDDYGALALGGLILEGKLQGSLIHGAEQSPGVWVARGAHIAEGVRLCPPVWVGPGAYVAAGASLGPLAVVSHRAVVERNAGVTEGLVLPNTVVGEGLQVRRAVASPHSLQSFSGSERVSVGDALVLDARDGLGRASASVRALAFGLATLLAIPWLLAASVALLMGRRVIEGERWPDGVWLRRGCLGLAWLDLWPRLLDVVAGRRFLLGSTDPQTGVCPAAFDIGSRLAPAGKPHIAERMWPWYAFHKSVRLDGRLLFGNRPGT